MVEILTPGLTNHNIFEGVWAIFDWFPPEHTFWPIIFFCEGVLDDLCPNVSQCVPMCPNVSWILGHASQVSMCPEKKYVCPKYLNCMFLWHVSHVCPNVSWNAHGSWKIYVSQCVPQCVPMCPTVFPNVSWIWYVSWYVSQCFLKIFMCPICVLLFFLGGLSGRNGYIVLT